MGLRICVGVCILKHTSICARIVENSIFSKDISCYMCMGRLIAKVVFTMIKC